MEPLEQRTLLTANVFLQGTAFDDANHNGALDPSEAYIAGATIQLYNADGTTLLGTATTDANGRYLFDDAHNVSGGNLAPGTYLLKQAPWAFVAAGAQALADLDAATVNPDHSITVTLADPADWQAHWNFRDFADNGKWATLVFDFTDDTNGAVRYRGMAGQMPMQFYPPLPAGQVVESYCTDFFNAFTTSPSAFTVIPATAPGGPAGQVPQNGDRVAYLFNHYGTSLAALPGLTGTVAQSAAGLQVAIWELEYGSAFELVNSGADYAAVAHNAALYLADSIGKSETALFLNVTSYPSTPLDTSIQSVIARRSFNFASIPAGSLSGFVYVDADNNGLKDSGETPIGGVTLTLTGTDDLGAIAPSTTTTAADGSYSFANLRPGTYTVTETQPSGYLDGLDALNNTPIPGSGTTDVVGGIAVASGADSQNNNFGEYIPSRPVTHGDFATIGFWHNKNGQALIKSLNGGSTNTALGNWLAGNFDRLFGANAGRNNLAGKTNAQVAAYFQTLFRRTGQAKQYCQVLGAALAVYATDSTLAGGTFAAAYGFNMPAGGSGADVVALGTYAPAFGGADTLTVMQMLQSANSQASRGVLSSTYGSRQTSAFDALVNSAGDIPSSASGLTRAHDAAIAAWAATASVSKKA